MSGARGVRPPGRLADTKERADVAKGICTFPACEDPTFARGKRWTDPLCQNHYMQDYRGEELRPVRKRGPYNPTRLDPGSKGACTAWGPAFTQGCDRVQKHGGGGLCGGHYMQKLTAQKRGQPVEFVPLREPRKPCLFQPCPRKAHTDGYCTHHRAEAIRQGKMETPRNRETGELYRMTNPDGYALVYDPMHPHAYQNGWVPEHIKVTSDQRGGIRFPKGTEVHHRNGRRDDNRPENLEVWYRKQPPGQRIEDLLPYAVGLIEQFRGFLTASDRRRLKSVV